MTVSTHETEPAVPRRSQASRRSESDRRMLRAAARLIARRGVAGTSLADVGVAAGYSRGLPVERFGSKLGLIGTLLEATDAWFQAHLVRILEGKSGLPALRLRLEAHLGSIERSRSATAALYSIYMESLCVMPELKPAVIDFTNRWRVGLAAHLREAQAAGHVHKDIDCMAEAGFLLAAMRGLMIQHLMDQATSDLAVSKDILLSHLRERLVTPQGRRMLR